MLESKMSNSKINGEYKARGFFQIFDIAFVTAREIGSYCRLLPAYNRRDYFHNREKESHQLDFIFERWK